VGVLTTGSTAAPGPEVVGSEPWRHRRLL